MRGSHSLSFKPYGLLVEVRSVDVVPFLCEASSVFLRFHSERL